MKYRYRYIDQMVEMIEGQTDPAHRMAVIWANKDDANLKALIRLLYDYRLNFEIGQLPAYRRKRMAGIDFHTAVSLLENRLNLRVLGAGQKFNFTIDILQQLQDRDAEVLERALRHQINFRIPLSDIKRVYPEIEGQPNLAVNAPRAEPLSALNFPGTIVKQPSNGHEVRVWLNAHGNFKFVDSDGNGLVLPDKPNSVFRKILSPFNNVVFSASLLGLTKDQSKVGNTATTNAAFAKMQAGELEAETICIRILDVADMISFNNYPKGNPRINMTFERRRAWLTEQNFGDNIFVRVADAIDVVDLEHLRKMENDITLSKDTLRYYQNDATWADGFHTLDHRSF